MTRNDALFRVRFPHLAEGRGKPVAKAANLSAYAQLALKAAKPDDYGKERALPPNPKAARPALVVTADAKPARHSFAHLRNAVFEYPPVAAIAAPPALKAGDVTGDTDKWATQRGQIEAAKQALKAGNVLCDADVWAANRRG